MGVVSQLNEANLFKELETNFNSNSDFLRILMVFLSQFSDKIKRQLVDAFTKSNMKFRDLTRSTLLKLQELPHILSKRNKISVERLRELTKETGLMKTNKNSLLRSSIVALRDYIQFLTSNHLVETTPRSTLNSPRQDIEYLSQPSLTNKIQKLESPRSIRSKKGC